MRIKLLTFLSGIVLGCGCGVKSPSELHGNYSIRYSHGSEALSILADGTFTQVYTSLLAGSSPTNSGTWQFKEADKELLLRDVIVYMGGARNDTQEKSTWRVRIAKRFDRISLIIDEENALEFEKGE